MNDFRTWLLTAQLGVNTPLSRFAARVKNDPAFPGKAYTWKEIQRYLSRKGATREALEVAAMAYNVYKGAMVLAG